MVDLSAEMMELWTSLGAPAAGRPRVIQVISARQGEGTSTVARELALYAAMGARRSVWLVDMDLLASPQHGVIRADPDRYGALGEAVAATPDGSMFFTVQPGARTSEGQPWPDAGYLAAHRVGQGRWWVTRFRREVLRAGQTVHVLARDDYWRAMRQHADVVIVDSPAADRSQAGVTIAPYVDQTLLVVSADQADVKPPAVLRDSIAAAGGAVSGLFFNRATVSPPKFLRGLIP
jgi:Mrp family chromosome partitioning ATPase